jgi:hypothetical protein
MTQIDIFQYEETIKNELNQNRLDPIEHFVLTNLKNYHVGKKKAYKSEDIIRDVKGRYGKELSKVQVRKLIEHIRLNRAGKTVIATAHNGYYIPTNDEVESAMSLQWSRIEKSMKILAEQDTLRFKKKLLRKFWDIYRKLDMPIENQLQMKLTKNMRGIVRYSGNHYLKGVAHERAND